MAVYNLLPIFASEPRIVGNAEVRPTNVGERYGKVLRDAGLPHVPFLLTERSIIRIKMI